MANPRAVRVAGRIQQVVATVIMRELKDPRLDFVTITDVRVSGDLQHAQVFYTVYGGEKQVKDAQRGLDKAKGIIRSHVGRAVGLRLTPTIDFVADTLPESARSFEDALVAAKARDNEVARAREGAQPAGEADPYKSSQEADSESAESALETSGEDLSFVEDTEE